MEQVDAQAEGRHAFYDPAQLAVTAAWPGRSDEFSIEGGRWKAAGEWEQCVVIPRLL